MQEYTVDEFQEFLYANSDSKYRDFHSKLTRSNYPLNGVRIPVLRKYAKDIAKSRDVSKFLVLKPQCYEQCMLKGLIIAHLRLDDSEFFARLESFICEIDDWALTDIVCYNIHRKDAAYLQKVKDYAKSKDVWFARWGIVAAMVNFFDEDEVVLEIAKGLVAEDYYVDMALAWLIQTLAVKNRDAAIRLMQDDGIGAQVKKFAAQKIRDSYRISAEDKAYFSQFVKR